MPPALSPFRHALGALVRHVGHPDDCVWMVLGRYRFEAITGNTSVWYQCRGIGPSLVTAHPLTLLEEELLPLLAPPGNEEHGPRPGGPASEGWAEEYGAA